MVAVHFLPVRSSRCTGVPTGRVSLCLVTSWKVGSGIHRVVAVHFLPVRSSRCTGVPTGKVSLCLVTSWKVGSGIHRVVAVRKDRSAGVAANNKPAPQNTHTHNGTQSHLHTHAYRERSVWGWGGRGGVWIWPDSVLLQSKYNTQCLVHRLSPCKHLRIIIIMIYGTPSDKSPKHLQRCKDMLIILQTHAHTHTHACTHTTNRCITGDELVE